MTIKTTAASVERDLITRLQGCKDQAAAVKNAHHAARKAILNDSTMSDLGKRGKLDGLKHDTRNKLDGIKADQVAYVNGLRTQLEKEFRGNQPKDASSVLLRRDAADRARKVADKREGMEVLNDAIANGDAEMAHAIGIRARNNVWGDVAEAYQAAHPDTADSASALAHVEATTSGAAYNLSNGATYSSPLD